MPRTVSSCTQWPVTQHRCPHTHRQGCSIRQSVCRTAWPLVKGGERVKGPPALPLTPPRMLPLSQLAQHSRDRPAAGGTPPTKLIRGFPAKGSSPAQVNTAAGSGMSCQEGGRTRLKPEVGEGSCKEALQCISGIKTQGRRGGERPPPGRVPRPPQWSQPSQTV